MNVVIIEDEQYSAEDLKKNILKSSNEIKIQAVLKSVKESLTYFKNNSLPDLFFSDIQLGDGLSFEIFNMIDCKSPVVFITAYDHHSLQAFKANGIDYILKPFDFKTIQESIKKYQTLTNSHFSPKLSKLLAYFEKEATNGEKQQAILVYQKDKIIPVQYDEIALFFIENSIVKVLCIDERQFVTGLTLEEIEQQMGNNFYRANRQYIVNRVAIKDVSQYFARKLSLNLIFKHEEKIIISKEKAAAFLQWLSNV